MKLEAKSIVKSADRAFDILEYIATTSGRRNFSQLLSALGIPRSSLFHLLNNLLARGYLQQDGAGSGYRLGERVRQLVEQAPAPSLAAIVTPFLGQLSNELNETSGFYIHVGDTMETVASVTGGQALAYTMKVGERAPLYAISAGKIVLAHMTPKNVADYLSRIELEAITPHTLKSKSRLRKEIAAAKQEGFAYSREEFTPGITGIATAVAYHGQVFGTLNLAVPTARFPAERDNTFRRHLRTTATSLAQKMSLVGTT